MGKIRIKTLGDEDKEKKQKQETKKRAEEKKAQKNAEESSAKTKNDADNTGVDQRLDQHESVAAKAKKKEKFATKKKQLHSKNYLAVASVVEKDKSYTLDEGIKLLEKLKRAKFDETVELHINTTDKGVSGSVVLPHGTGKEIRIAIANQSADPKAVEVLVKKIESGQIDFDVLIATPDSMPRLARVARVLGPKGLMPNPKNGTVSLKPEDVAKKYQGGQVNFKTEAKFPILHLAVGKVSFGEKKLSENIKSALNAIQIQNIKTITLKSTMSPAIHIILPS